MPQSTPTRVCAETVYLLVSAVALTTAAVLWLLDVDSRGVYAILTATAAGSFAGYLVRSEGTRVVRRMQASERQADQASGLDPEVITSARTIARQLLGQR